MAAGEIRMEVETCVICLEEFSIQDVGTLDSCDHYFCLNCILNWSKGHNRCPLDRKRFCSIRAKHAGEKETYQEIAVETNNGDSLRDLLEEVIEEVGEDDWVDEIEDEDEEWQMRIESGISPNTSELEVRVRIREPSLMEIPDTNTEEERVRPFSWGRVLGTVDEGEVLSNVAPA